MSQPQLDVLSVGDVVTDAFIKLQTDQEKIEKDENGNPNLSIPFGTKVPFDHSEIIEGVGNAANAAVTFARLGLNSGLVANVGSDRFGRDIIEALENNNVDTRFVYINRGKPSHYHYVLWYKDERTILVNSIDYDYRWPRFRIIDLPKWMYFSSVGKYADEYHDQISSWLESHQPVKLAFQPGTFQIKLGTKRLQKIYERSEVIAVNREEATTISGGDHHDINDLFDKLHKLGPKIVLISDGHDGAYASDGEKRWKMPIYPDPKPPFERTGAGDAFTSTFVAALAKGADIESALLWAPINSMSVVQQVGAQAGLLDEKQINKFLREAPNWYHPERLK